MLNCITYFAVRSTYFLFAVAAVSYKHKDMHNIVTTLLQEIEILRLEISSGHEICPILSLSFVGSYYLI